MLRQWSIGRRLSLVTLMVLALPDHHPLATAPTLPLGRVLAEDIVSPVNVPAHINSAMDGWAVRSADLLASPTPQVRLRRRGESAAGHPHEQPLHPGEALRISTGALIPAGADMVVAQEDCRVHGDHVDVDRDQVGEVRPGHFVRLAGSDVLAGAPLLPAGSLLGPGELGLLAGCGHATAHVHRPPRVAILCTGDELVPVGAWPQRGQVVSSNGLMLAWMAREVGAEVTDLGIAVDEPDTLRRALERGLDFDVLVTCGGISVGDHDLIKPVLERMGATIHFHGVAQKPGKPMLFGTLRERPIIALPGNPRAVLILFWEYVLPFLRAMQGARDPWLRAEHLTITHAITLKGDRAEFRAAQVKDGRVTLLADEGSHMLRSLVDADALAYFPATMRTLNVNEPVEIHHITR